MKNFYRSTILFVVAFVAVVGFSVQAQARQVCFDVVAAEIGDNCTLDADCIDELACNGVESCAIEASDTIGLCVAGEAVDCGDQLCDETDGLCYDCLIDGDCDEGETCEAGVCVMPEPECTVDADCDESDLCIIARCSGEGVCLYTPVDCEGDVCDPSDGSCVECLTDDNCEEDETCDDNMCIAGDCPEGTPDEVIAFDLDGDCLLNKDEYKKYSDTLKIAQKAEKTALKTQQKIEKDVQKAKHSLEKDKQKAIKTNYYTK